MIDAESEGSTRFRNPRARGCSDPSVARALLRAREFLNSVDPEFPFLSTSRTMFRVYQQRIGNDAFLLIYRRLAARFVAAVQ